MSVKFSNNATTELASSIGTSDTSITVVDASKFPILTAGDYTYVTLDTDTASPTREIVKVTAISGNVLTVTRGMDGTSPASFAAGTKVELRLTAALLNDVAGVNPSGEPIGFPDKSQTTITFDSGTRTFSITPTGASFDVYCKGVKYTYTTVQLVTIPNTTGLHFIYFSASGVLSTQMSYFTWEEHAPTAYVYWNATTQQAVYFADERHGITLDWQTHEYLHRTRGAAIANGFSASNYTTTGLGATDADAQIDIGGGTFFDEDMQVDIVSTNTPVAGTWQQDLAGPARIPVLYLSGSAWVIDAPTNFPFKVVSGVPQYNLYSDGTWSTASVTNNSYFVSWILATNNLTYPVVSIISQAPTNQLSVAEAMTFEGLNLNGFPSVEFRPLYKVIYQYKDGFANSVKSSTIAVYDLRSISSAGVAAALVQDHGNLSGLTDDDHAQYVHVSEVRTPSAAVKNSFFPSQVGQTGKYLSTDGTNTVWEPAPSGSLSFTGDVTGTGSTGSSVSLTLAASGVVAGQYTKVTVDAKGRVTAGTDITSSDVTTALGYTPYNSSNPAGYLTGITGTQVTTALGYTPPQPNGTGATGTWGINITGNAATVTNGLYNANGGTNSVSSNIIINATSDNWMWREQASGGNDWYRGPSTANFGIGANRYVFSSSGNSPSGELILERGTTKLLEVLQANLQYKGNVVLHASNYNSYALPLSGGTVSGTLSVSSAYGTMAAAKGSYFGYSSGYGAVVLGSTSAYQTTCIGVDPIGNASGSFSGLGHEVMFRNGVSFITPNSSNNSYHTYFTMSGGVADYSAALRQAGNQVLHAANYSSYALPLSGGTISSGSGYPLILNTTQRYTLWLRNTAASGTGWWLTHDADGRFVIHGNGVGDRAALDSSGNWYASGQMYATGSQHLVLNTGNYSSYALPLSGGTLTGEFAAPNISIGGQGRSARSAFGGNIGATAGSWNNAQLELKNTDAGTVALAFHRAGYTSDTLEVRDGSGMRLNGNFLLHAGNYSSYALPLSGGTLTGELTQNGNNTWYAGSNNHRSNSEFNFLTYSGGAQNGRFKGIQVSDSYSGSVPTNGIVFATDTTLVRSAAGQLSLSGDVVLDAGNYSSYALPLSGGTLSSTLQVNGNIKQGNDLARPYASWSGSGATTGMVIFSFPGGSGNYGMVHCVFDIYEYSSNTVSTVIVGGHNWNGSWYNYGANVIGSCAKEVRLGFKDGKYCVVFGVSGSSWSYGTIVLRKIHNGGYYTNNMDMGGSFTTAQTTTESFTSVSGDLRNLITPANIDVGAIGYAANSFRAPVFYDRDNTGYYVDPASTSNLWVVQLLNGKWFPENNASGNSIELYVRPNADNTYVWRHIYGGSGTGFGTGVGGYGIYAQHLGGDYSLLFNAAGYVTAPYSLRSPIFYDSNDTNYYVNPASTSQIRKTNIIASGASWDDGLNLYGSGGSIRWNLLVDSGSSNDFRIAYQNSDRLYLSNGGAVTANGSLRSPIFYDSNNTAYYVDPASATSGSFAGFVGIGNNYGSDDGGWGSRLNVGGNPHARIDVRCANDGIVTTMYSHQGQNRGYVGTTTNHRLAIGVNFNEVQSVYSGYSESIGSYRAPLFYDSDNTGYYLDAASTSNLNSTISQAFRVGTDSAWKIRGNGGNVQLAFEYSTSSALSDANIKAYLTGGTFVANGDVRTPIFYDSNDTSYYCNPNDWSLLWGLSTYYIRNNHGVGTDHPFGVYFDSGLNTAYAIYRESGAWTNPFPDLRIAFHTGIKLGASSGYNGIRFYTDYDMSSQVMSVNNGSDPLGGGNVYVNYNLQAGDSLRAPIFYDSNNTSYYCDPNSTSQFNQARFVNRIAVGNGSTPYLNTGTAGIWFSNGGGASHFAGSHDSDNSWWGVYTNGAWRSWLTGSGSWISTGDQRAPIFYDSNDTGYYVDPLSTTRLNQLTPNYITQITSDYSATSIYGVTLRGYPNQYLWLDGGTSTTSLLLTSNWDWDRQVGFHWTPATSGSNGGTLRIGQLSKNSTSYNHTYTYMHMNGADRFYWDWNGVFMAYGDSRAPAFYDYNNTSYYADFGSTGDSIRCAGNIVAYYSDERLKTHLGRIENAVEKVQCLEGFYYEANAIAQSLGYEPRREVGVSAQAVQKVLPEIVSSAPIDQNYLTIDYERLVPLLIEAIKEQQSQISAMSVEINSLKERLQ